MQATVCFHNLHVLCPAFLSLLIDELSSDTLCLMSSAYCGGSTAVSLLFQVQEIKFLELTYLPKISLDFQFQLQGVFHVN